MIAHGHDNGDQVEKEIDSTLLSVNGLELENEGLVEEEEEVEKEIVFGDNLDAPYTIGVCARDKKANSKQMCEILSRLPRRLFRIVIFGDEIILNDPIEKWPVCDGLIAFFSTGFPLEKAKAYVALRDPVVVNDLDKQDMLMDRRDVYRILQENDIPLPR
jgi:inositol hexakisphosphate/diphosphoinositol-pentakisphosphate kinase